MQILSDVKSSTDIPDSGSAVCPTVKSKTFFWYKIADVRAWTVRLTRKSARFGADVILELSAL